MPYPVYNIIADRSAPICVSPSDSVVDALNRMIEHDFSQLPVVDQEHRPLGMVTYESITRALRHIGCAIKDLNVGDVIVTATQRESEDDLFDALDRLRDVNAVLIVDSEKRLIGIITSYDSTEYFRLFAEDMMLVRDIETMIKDLIIVSFMNGGGEIDLEGLKATVDRVTNSRSVLKSQCRKIVESYSGSITLVTDNSRIDQAIFDDCFEGAIPKRAPKDFEDLSLGQFIQILLDKERWVYFQSILKINRISLHEMLNEVRVIRNKLMHFREEISIAERDKLHFACDWLSRHQALIPISIQIENSAKVIEQVAVKESVIVQVDSTPLGHQIIPVEESPMPYESRYAKIRDWLVSQAITSKKFRVKFTDIEGILESSLPVSARKHRAWWANDPTGHSHAAYWLDAGWRTSYVNMTDELVTFVRIADRQEAYIRFYSELTASLRSKAPFDVKESSPGGQCWITILDIPPGNSREAVFAYSFSTLKRFRVELYIDCGDKDKNKRTFDLLCNQKLAVERELGMELSWERINKKRACRICIYRSGAIESDQSALDELQSWAVDVMIRFYQAIFDRANEAIVNSYSIV